MLIDGLEDWLATGNPSSWFTNPYEQDSDGDGISDSLEIGIYGKMTIASFIQHHGSASTAEQKLRYARVNSWQTNPRNADTDGDGIRDGEDINPNGLKPPVFQIVFDCFRMQDAIDPPGTGYSRWSPEPYFIIGVNTAAGSFSLETPDLPEVPLDGFHTSANLAGVLTGNVFKAAGRAGSNEGLFAPTAVADAILPVLLPENFSALQQSLADPGEVDPGRIAISVFMGDVDCTWRCSRPESDWIDLNPDVAGPSREAKTFRHAFHIGQANCGPKTTLPKAADGRMDSIDASTFDPDDDGHLILRGVDWISQLFFQRASVLAKSREAPLLPPMNGQSFAPERC